MRQMVLRFFWYIWGAIVGTSILMLVLTIRLDLPPPGHIPIGTAQQLVQAVLGDAPTAKDSDQIRAIIAQSPALAGHFILSEGPDADCGGFGVVIRLSPDSCVRAKPPPAMLGGLDRFMPLLTPLAIGLVVSLGFALLLARRFVRPIRRLGQGLTALSQGRLDRRIGPELDRSEPAIADVGRAFDMAAGKLQELTESRSRLFHDISHEIRSPLARLQAQTALLRQNPARLPAMLPRMDADIGRIDQLVEEILTLARIERGGLRVATLVGMDLIDILDPILRDAEFEGQARHVTLRYQGPDQLPMQGDPELLHRATENIIRNALRYAPPDSAVEVTVRATDPHVSLTVRDHGPGVEQDQLASIFHAFVRDETCQGTGLGLTIAANAIRLHGGTIKAENAQSGGLQIRCRLPRHPGEDA